MKTLLILPMILLGSNVFASYMEKETQELKCKSLDSSYNKIEVTIQKETVLGFDGFAKENNAKVKLDFKGKILGTKMSINEKVLIKKPGIDANGRRFNLTREVSFILSQGDKTISASHLSDLTNDPTMPGMSIKVKAGVVQGLGNAVINLVTDDGKVGILRLSAEGEYPTSMPVLCSTERDFAEPGNPYQFITPIK